MRSEQTLVPEGSARSSGSRVRRPTTTTRLIEKYDKGTSSDLVVRSPAPSRLRAHRDVTRRTRRPAPFAASRHRRRRQRVERHGYYAIAGVGPLDRALDTSPRLVRGDVEDACDVPAARPRAADRLQPPGRLERELDLDRDRVLGRGRRGEQDEVGPVPQPLDAAARPQLGAR